jgi:hypothetical protein
MAESMNKADPMSSSLKFGRTAATITSPRNTSIGMSTLKSLPQFTFLAAGVAAVRGGTFFAAIMALFLFWTSTKKATIKVMAAVAP